MQRAETGGLRCRACPKPPSPFLFTGHFLLPTFLPPPQKGSNLNHRRESHPHPCSSPYELFQPPRKQARDFRKVQSTKYVYIFFSQLRKGKDNEKPWLQEVLTCQKIYRKHVVPTQLPGSTHTRLKMTE